MNVCIFKGNLTRDPETVYVTSGDRKVAKSKITLAVNDKRGGREQTSFLDMELWDSSAEVLQKYAKKGDPLLVEASIRQENWEKDGQKRSKLTFRVNRFDFLGKAKANETEPEAESQNEGEGESETEPASESAVASF